MERLQGAILAAGMGARLRPLTDERPKPLVTVGGVSLLEYAIDALAGLGISTLGINLYHRAEQIPGALSHRREHIEYVFETTLEGTGGGLRGITQRLPRGTAVVLNGDAFFDFDLHAAVAAHRRSGAMATLVLRAPLAHETFGRVAVDATDQIQRIAEVNGPEPDREDLRFGVFTGVQIVEPALLDALPAVGPCDVLRTAYARRLSERARIVGHFVDEPCVWLDVGTLDRYLDAQDAVLAGARAETAKLPAADGQGRRVHAQAQVDRTAELVGPCAILEGAIVEAGSWIGPGCVIEAGARVTRGSRLLRTVVWSGATAGGAHEGAVVRPTQSAS
ncbi:MAG: NDP-sugar synthase [Myxococcales bacterium]|nr:NDP-sugar synthase [Myxococcales bacterium]